MADDESVDIRIQLKNAAKFQRDAKASARSIDNIGDQARQAARQLRKMNAASSKTRVQLGPFSTSVRGGALAVGGLVMATGKLTPSLFGLAEATATVVGGGAAAGGVGLLALAQGAGVAKLGMGGLMDALGGSEEAVRGLSPEVRELFNTLDEAKKTLRGTAEAGLLPGLTRGADKAMRNFPVLNEIVKDTAETLGGLGEEAGGMLGSQEWGRDLKRLGGANVNILDDLGHGGLNFADALRHIAVEAAPLAEWLAESLKDGSGVVEMWAKDARASGDMARFFREARRDLSLLASIGGHSGRGIINLFGSQDVDGTETLRNLDRIMARFERWTASPAVRNGLGDAIVAEIPDAVGALMTGIAHAMPVAGGAAAKLFFEGFMEADAWGKLLMGGFLFKKLGGFKAAGGLMSRELFGGKFASRGTTPANPVFVSMVGAPGVPGPGAKPGGKPATPARQSPGARVRGGVRAVGGNPYAQGAALVLSTEVASRYLPPGVQDALFGPDMNKVDQQLVADLRREHPDRVIDNEVTVKIDSATVSRYTQRTLRKRQARN